MANPTNGYGSYRGRGHPVFRLLLVLFAVVAVLLVLGVSLLQPYIVYSADGVKINLPFLSKDLPDDPLPSPELIIETPPPTPTPTLSPLERMQQVQRYHPLLTVEQLAKNPGMVIDSATGYLVGLKDEQGMLAYISAVEKAVTMKSSGSDPAVNDSVAQFIDDPSLRSVGVLACFKDQTAGDGDYNFCILSNSGYRWVDDTDVRWISPTKPAVRQYILDLALEAADLGFDEILLTYAHYPASGIFGYIKNGADYDQKQLGSVVDGFYQEVSAAFALRECLISVFVCDEFLENPQEFRSGQTAASMLANFDRIWYSEALADLALERVFGGDAALMAARGVALDTANPEFPLY